MARQRSASSPKQQQLDERKWPPVVPGESFFSKRVVRLWNRLPRGVMDSLSLEVFKGRVYVVFRGMA